MASVPDSHPAKWGRRPDGLARNPWRHPEDAQALGYRSAAAFRREQGLRRGISVQAAVGHPKPDEPTAAALQRVRRGQGSLDDLQMAAIARSRVLFNGYPKFDADATARRLRRSDDRPTLARLASASADEWRELATVQVPGNPAFYHGGSER